MSDMLISFILVVAIGVLFKGEPDLADTIKIKRIQYIEEVTGKQYNE